MHTTATQRHSFRLNTQSHNPRRPRPNVRARGLPDSPTKPAICAAVRPTVLVWYVFAPASSSDLTHGRLPVTTRAQVHGQVT